MKIICAYCKKESEKLSGCVNRAKRLGLNIYCSRICSGLGRRVERTEEQKKQIKSEYDKQRRKELHNLISEKKKAFFKKDYTENPEKYRAWRKKRSPKHSEYCRQPEYKKKKVEYDKQHRAKKYYGEYAESFLLIMDISKEYDNRIIKQQQGLTNKAKIRKRSWQQKTNSLQRI